MSALLTPSSARALLDRHGLAMRKRDGQHLLVDPNTVRGIASSTVTSASTPSFALTPE